jgi:hypothetical protein
MQRDRFSKVFFNRSNWAGINYQEIVMQRLFSILFFLILTIAVGCSGEKNRSADLKKDYIAKYGEARNAVRQSQGVQSLPPGWDCEVSAVKMVWTSPTPTVPGFIGKTICLAVPGGRVEQEEDTFLLTAEVPRNAISIITQLDGDKAGGQEARQSIGTAEGKAMPIKDAKKLIQAIK